MTQPLRRAATFHLTPMTSFHPGDRVIAINTDLTRPLCPGASPGPRVYSFPDGHLRTGTIYHIQNTGPSPDGHQSLHLTGLRVLCDGNEIPWNSSRFRKVSKQGHPPVKRAREEKAPLVKISDKVRQGPKAIYPFLTVFNAE